MVESVGPISGIAGEGIVKSVLSMKFSSQTPSQTTTLLGIAIKKNTRYFDNSTRQFLSWAPPPKPLTMWEKVCKSAERTTRIVRSFRSDECYLHPIPETNPHIRNESILATERVLIKKLQTFIFRAQTVRRGNKSELFFQKPAVLLSGGLPSRHQRSDFITPAKNTRAVLWRRMANYLSFARFLFIRCV